MVGRAGGSVGKMTDLSAVDACGQVHDGREPVEALAVAHRLTGAGRRPVGWLDRLAYGVAVAADLGHSWGDHVRSFEVALDPHAATLPPRAREASPEPRASTIWFGPTAGWSRPIRAPRMIPG